MVEDILYLKSIKTFFLNDRIFMTDNFESKELFGGLFIYLFIFYKIMLMM